ncbi:MAG: peptide chain release factor N(5)-glutamine methyltransferase [Nitrospirota bacterium]
MYLQRYGCKTFRGKPNPHATSGTKGHENYSVIPRLDRGIQARPSESGELYQGNRFPFSGETLDSLVKPENDIFGANNDKKWGDLINIINDMNALNKLRKAKEFLEKSGVEDAAKNAELIISHCLGIDRASLYRDNPIITEDLISKIDEFLKRREKREPLQYVIGYTKFYGLKIKVGPGVLIPRPETELLVEEAIKAVRRHESTVSPPTHPSPSRGEGKGGGENSSKITGHRSLSILDLCTGSGCLALALAKEFPEAKVYGTDTSEVAISYAKENVELNNINNVTFLKGNLFEPLKNLVFDLIVSNPPYIRKDDIKNLQLEIKNWEPVEALDGGEDGLDYYRMIIPGARGYLKESGYLILELGVGQSDAVRKMAEDKGFKNISLVKDYAGIERIFITKGESRRIPDKRE